VLSPINANHEAFTSRLELGRCHVPPRKQSCAYYDKKLAEGKTHREARRSLKRQISDAAFARLRTDARRTAGQVRDPGGQ
jgi:hypothetical protein